MVNSLSMPRWIAVVLAMASGFVAELAFPGFDLWFLIFVAIGGLVVSMSSFGAGFSAFLGFLWGMAFFLPHIRFAEYAVGGPLPWFALSALQALFIALACWAWGIARRISLVKNNMFAGALAFAVIWVAVESLRSNYPWGGFPWGRLAFSQSDSPLGNLTWLTGIPGVSLVVAVAGYLVGIAVIALLSLNVWRLGVAAMGAMALIGAGLFTPFSTEQSSEDLVVGAVQGNVSKPGADAFGNRQEVLDNHVEGTHALATQQEFDAIDVVVWPENGSDIDPNVDANAAAIIDGAAKAVNAPVIVGTQEYPESGGRYNLSVLWEPGVGITDEYAKQKPVPFGEYIPERDFFAKIYPDVARIGTDMIAGTEPATLSVPVERLGREVSVGTIICFEVAIDSVLHDSVNNGAEIIFVQTNNASFGPTNESIQQLAMSRLRAIETGRAVVHVSTVGVSGIYLPNGVELERTGHFTAEQMLQQLPLLTEVSPAVKMGELPTYVMWAGSVLLLVMGAFARRKSA